MTTHIDHETVEALIAQFQKQIKAQEGLKTMGIKNMADSLKDDLECFAEAYDYSLCDSCGKFEHDMQFDKHGDFGTCRACQVEDGKLYVEATR